MYLLDDMGGIEQDVHTATIDIDYNLWFFIFHIGCFFRSQLSQSYRRVIVELSGGFLLDIGQPGIIPLQRSPGTTTTVGRSGLPA